MGAKGTTEVNPFFIEGPALVSFSGGRTSGYMLRRILDAYDGTLPPDVHVLFANTGKERQETLDFVRDCATQWGVSIVWLEYVRRHEYEVVTYETASRNGEPFERAINDRKYLPNPVTRFCTQSLKVELFATFMSRYDTWDNVIGLRADEPRRVAKRRAANDEQGLKWRSVMPLAEAGVTEGDVLTWWRSQPFQLALPVGWSNCDLCMMKGFALRVRLARERPDLLSWWERMEEERGATFRNDTPSYRKLRVFSERQGALPLDGEASNIPCACTD